MSAAPTRSAPPPPEEDDRGASANERLLAAAKNDSEEMLEDALSELEDINYADGVIHASTSVLEPILCHDSCDVDLRTRLQGDTPLHIAVRQRWEESPGLRLYLVESLLEAGADTTIRNRHNQKPIDLLPPSADPESDDDKVRKALRRAEAESLVADKGDVVDEDDDIIDPNDVASDSD
ncbi:hypothetical protein JCM24511_00727 [Saitozyma sp. JCM 24511]|nr:hypothetical protein JCM24511_00727 [Saitozyma sp. JCM 24511]